MTSFGFREILLFLFLHQVRSEEAETMFRAEGNVFEIGYCFGVDYIVVYRSSPEGDLLLGNSSDDSAPVTPPDSLKGRIHISKNNQLLGLQIHHLTHLDSGFYTRECWKNQTRVSHHTQQLLVCDEEIEAMEVGEKEEHGRAELLCNSTSIDLEGTSVRWFYEMHPSYRLKLFLDSSVSLNPLVEELQGAIEVKDSGALLLLNNSLLKNNQEFYCLVIKGTHCLSFQNMFRPVLNEGRDIFVSQGDRVVMNCSFEGDNQQWETPLGSLNDSSMRINQMYISVGDKLEDFSLVIPAVSEEHNGEYSCITPSLEVQYSLYLCPQKQAKKEFFSEGANISLECDVGKEDSQRVQWYRQETAGEYELIHDSSDKTIPIPQDLRGRMTLPESGFSLRLSNVEMKDGRLYWCIVLKDPEPLEKDHDYKDDYDEDLESGDGQYWHDTHMCIFKQNILLLIKKIRQDPGPSTIADPPETTDATPFALGAVLTVLVVVAVVVGVIVVKKRAKTPVKQQQEYLRSELNSNRGIEMNVDPGCSDRLTHNEENDA